SPHVGETRAVVADVLAGSDDVAVLDAPAVLAEVPGLRCQEPDERYAQFWPHRHGTDAIFLALFRRRPVPGAAADTRAGGGPAPRGAPGPTHGGSGCRRCRPAGPRRSRLRSRCRCTSPATCG